MRRTHFNKIQFLSVLFLVLFVTCNNPDADKTILVTGITINDRDISVQPYAPPRGLTATVLPDNASNKKVTWSSSNPTVAIIDPDTGLLVFSSVTGIATITATAKDGSGISDSVTVTISNEIIKVQNVTIADGNFSLTVGAIKTLKANITPANASNKKVDWSSSDEDKATVSTGGVVTAKAKGEVVITATSQENSAKSDSVTVTIIPAPSVMTPQEIFESLKGQKVTTYGWADLYDSGAGLSYTDPASLILIDDVLYPNAVDKRTAFTNTINADDEKFIIISGDIDLSDGKISDSNHSYFNEFNPTTHARLHGDISFNIGSNTTIIGINNARFMFGGLTIRNGKQNIIIQNITFWDAHGSTAYDTSIEQYKEEKASATALQIENSPGGSGIWVDHCKFTDGTCVDLSRNYNHDGGFDIKYGRFITCSWTEFTNHDKVMLVGSNDTGYLIATERQITLHHNYFHGTTQRMPRTRGTQMHVYNNYYNNIGNPDNGGSFMGPGVGAEFIVENNFFGSKIGSKNIEWFDTNPSYPVKFYYTGNNKANSDLTFWNGRASNSKPWTPAYTYTLDSNADLPESIPLEAGPTLVFYK